MKRPLAPLEYVANPRPVEELDLEQLRAEVIRLRAREKMFLRRFEDRAEHRQGLRVQGRNDDGTMRCPCADILGLKPCTDHSYSGCGGKIPE